MKEASWNLRRSCNDVDDDGDGDDDGDRILVIWTMLTLVVVVVLGAINFRVISLVKDGMKSW